MSVGDDFHSSFSHHYHHLYLNFSSSSFSFCLFLLLLAQPKVLNAHDDKVRSMAVIEGGLIVSGSGSNDGYANVWKLLDWFKKK